MAIKDWMPWNQGPPVLRRQVRNFLIPSAIALVLAVALAVLSKPLGIPRDPWGRFGPLFFGLMPGCLFMPLLLRARWHIRTQFRQAGGRLCTHCGYIVGPLGERGTCPECGEHFDADDDEATWHTGGFKL